jgi:hypothetical protein
VSARIRAGSRFKRFLCFVLIDVRWFRVPQVEDHWCVLSNDADNTNGCSLCPDETVYLQLEKCSVYRCLQSTDACFLSFIFSLFSYSRIIKRGISQAQNQHEAYSAAYYVLYDALFDPEDGGDILLRNVGLFPSEYTAPYLRRQNASWTPL